MKTITSTVLILLKNDEQNPNLQVLPKSFFLKKATLASSKTYTVGPLLNINSNLSSSTCLACLCKVPVLEKWPRQTPPWSFLCRLWALQKLGMHLSVNLASFHTFSSSYFVQASLCYMSNLYPSICKHLSPLRKLPFSACLKTFLDTSNWANSILYLREKHSKASKAVLKPVIT